MFIETRLHSLTYMLSMAVLIIKDGHDSQESIAHNAYATGDPHLWIQFLWFQLSAVN
jgi:hypothetical protein